MLSSSRIRYLAGFTLLAGALSAPVASARVAIDVLNKSLEHPWAIAFIGHGRMLVTERPGRIRIVEADGKLGPPLQGVPKVDAGGQGGMLDIVTDRDFKNNRTVYFCYAEPGEGGNSTALASARLSEDRLRLEQVKVIFSQQPKVRSRMHFGCRIVEQDDGTLYLTLGERFGEQEEAQRLDNHLGKVVRINKDGTVPQDNPFAGRSMGNRGVLREIWSFGHRNPQGAALGPDRTLWIHEHGPQGGDEINRPQPGTNYGWPVITYGEQYGGGKIGDGLTAHRGMEQPLHYWTPSIAPSGMAFLQSTRYGKDWQGSLFIGSLKFRYLARLEVQGDKVVRKEKLLRGIKQRIRDVREGPDGLLYILTDHAPGQLIRLRPKP
jgi:glucose/arabinose dehydrogenase